MDHDLYDSPLPEIIRNRLPESLFARHVYFSPTVGSTNTSAKELAKKGAAEGSMVLAEEQTKGKGRLGRHWHSPSGVNLYFSIVFRPSFSIDRVFSLTMLTALALVDGIEHATGLKTLIKWPNDVFMRDRKVAGILTEFSAKGKRIDYVVIGAGINVNWDTKGKPDLENIATSLKGETGYPVSRVDLLVDILEPLERYYRLFLKGQDRPIHTRWNELSMVIGKEVLVGPAGTRKRALAKGIDRNGALIIRDENGAESSIICGDVTVLFPSLQGSNR